jgi:hypothetical protein
MRALGEVWDSSVLVNLLGNHGNSIKVILGGNDGVLVTVDANGKIKVTPPEGPGDPETFGSDQIDISECADTWGKASSSDLPGIV